MLCQANQRISPSAMEKNGASATPGGDAVLRAFAAFPCFSNDGPAMLVTGNLHCSTAVQTADGDVVALTVAAVLVPGAVLCG